MTSAPAPHPAMDADRISRAWRALMAYRGLSLQVFDAQAAAFEALPSRAQPLLAEVPVRLSHAAEAVEHNAELLERVATLAGLDGPFDPEDVSVELMQLALTDFPDVVDGLLAIVKDWSSVGAKDRLMAYDPVLKAVEEAAHDAISAGSVQDRHAFSVLVPGAGLGRLAWELARLGFAVQGVETCYAHLFMCNFVLNGDASPENPLHLFPYAHHTGMADTAEEQLKQVSFPDANPRSLVGSDFSMVAGEFLELYQEDEVWDCVATCFCIENSHSIIAYVKRIAAILKTGGVWVNHGCLDFRYDDSETEPSVEITAEELELVVARCGLRIIRRETFTCRPPFVASGIVHEEVVTTFLVAVRL